MACHYRVAVEGREGRPARGAARHHSRRRRHAAAAAAGRRTDSRSTMCTDGKPVSAAKAKAAGIVDEIVDGDLRSGAIAFAKAQAAAGERRKTREIAIVRRCEGRPGRAACQQARGALAKSARGARAPIAAIDAIEAASTLPFDEGSRRERELFADCVVSTESKALRHLFFAEREAAKVPDVPKRHADRSTSGAPPSSAPAPWAAASR